MFSMGFKTPLFVGHNEAYLPPIKDGNHVLQIVSGPGAMFLLLIVQLIKKQLTGTHTSKIYDNVWKFLSKAEARDKIGRIVQYGCRALQGFLVHSPQSPLNVWKPVLAEVQTTLAWARRTHRWGKEMPHITKLGKAVLDADLLEAAQCGVLITFLVQDHIYFLLKVGILKFKNYTAVQWHRRNLRFITFSHVLNFSICLRSFIIIMQKQEAKDPKYTGSSEALKTANAESYEHKKMMFRYVLTFIQMLHVSQVKVFDDWYIGIMGMVSSYIDASKQWPVSTK